MQIMLQYCFYFPNCALLIVVLARVTASMSNFFFTIHDINGTEDRKAGLVRTNHATLCRWALNTSRKERIISFFSLHAYKDWLIIKLLPCYFIVIPAHVSWSQILCLQSNLSDIKLLSSTISLSPASTESPICTPVISHSLPCSIF